MLPRVYPLIPAAENPLGGHGVEQPRHVSRADLLRATAPEVAQRRSDALQCPPLILVRGEVDPNLVLVGGVDGGRSLRVAVKETRGAAGDGGQRAGQAGRRAARLGLRGRHGQGWCGNDGGSEQSTNDHRHLFRCRGFPTVCSAYRTTRSPNTSFSRPGKSGDWRTCRDASEGPQAVVVSETSPV